MNSTMKQQKKKFVHSMFDDIHSKYNFLNTVLSFGQDNRWRKLAVRDTPSDATVIDLCSAGGQLARTLFSRGDFHGHIILADISLPMIRQASQILGTKYSGRYEAVICDVEWLPFKDNAFDAAMSAFSLRNLTDLPRFSMEANRALSPAGIARFLEIGHPENRFLSRIFNFYFYDLSPKIARIFTSKSYAYRYLSNSLRIFPGQSDVIKILGDGWSRSSYRNIMGGMAAIYMLAKANDERTIENQADTLH